jgi:phage terminase small subunit
MGRELTRTGSNLAVIKKQTRPTAVRVPPMPASLPASLKTDYSALMKSLIAAETWRPNLMPTVESYLSALYSLRSSLEALERDGAYFMTEQGPKPHPAAAVLAKATSSLATAARLLGINVSSSHPMMESGKRTSAESDAKPSSKWSA